MPSAAYLWSPQLQRAADGLPANTGRSSLVHGLIRALGLLENEEGLEKRREENMGMMAREGHVEEGDGVGTNGGEDSNHDKGRADEAGNADQSAVSPRDLQAEDEQDEQDEDEARARPIRGIRVVPPDPSFATQAEIRRYHEARYVDYLLQPPGDSSDSSDSSGDESGSEDGRPRKRRREIMGLEDDCPRFPELRAYVALVASATLTACRLLATGQAQTAIVWDGGRHHALRARASGFCYVADAVLGILLLAREGVPHTPPSSSPSTARKRRARILYLDLDLHYGDGVAQAFASPTHFPYPLPQPSRVRAPQVLTLSIHHQSRVFFPPGAPGLMPADTPHPFSLSLPLAAFAHSPTYARAWRCVEMIKDAWEPDYVVLQLGVDGLPGDRIGQWGAWSPHGVGGSTWVVEQVMGWDRPTAVLGGGGYEHANAARAWALATAAVLGREGVSAETDVPDHEYFREYAPSYTLEVPESNAPDENTDEALDEAERTYAILAERIREIIA